MQAWWAEETSLKNIKKCTVQKLLTGSVIKSDSKEMYNVKKDFFSK